MTPPSTGARPPALLLAAGALLALLVVVSLSVGATGLGPSQWLAGDDLARRVLVEIRLPRILLAIVVGASLASAGLASQALLGSPLADPFTLGISGGAALGAAVAGFAGLAPLPGGLGGGALVGAAAATLLVFLAARRTGRLDAARLLLAGLVANALFSALILLLLSASRGDVLRGMVFWMMGSLAGADLHAVLFLVPYAAAGALLLVLSSRPLDLLLAGEESAASLGVDVERVKRVVFLGVAALTAAAVAAAGVVGFVGLLVPHAARRLVGSSHRAALPASALLGASALVAADLAARTVVSPTEVPVGALAALVGAPLFLLLLLGRREGGR